MEENKSNLNLTMTWGLFLGLVLIVLHLITYLMGVYKSPSWLGILNYVVIIGAMVMAQLKTRNDLQGGYITYGKSLGTGILVALFSSIIYAFYFIILTKFIDPSYMDKMLEVVEELYYQKGMPEDQIQMAMEMARKFTTPIFTALSTMFGFVVMGTIFSLITSAFIKRQEPMFTEQNTNEE
ncbi:MAG TPA: DUF4199 domain-containing protein [Tenuifilaceae bacterium]|nr:DUF4199 domain-containing protein [Tenuifilaceae bacterium]